MKQFRYRTISFTMGAMILCIFSTFQKMYIGSPLMIAGYYVPFFFGGICGFLIGLWNFKLKQNTIKLEKAHDELEEKVKERTADLEQALDEIKQLSGLLPVCSSCKKIRDEKGLWNQMEEYIRDHSEAEFSHSICPECAKKLYPDLEINDDKE